MDRLADAVSSLLTRDAGKAGDDPEPVTDIKAEVRAAVRHVEIARPVKRGTVLAAEDLNEVVSDVGMMPMAPMPALADAVGSRAGSDLREGDIAAITPPHLAAAVANMWKPSGDILAAAKVGAAAAKAEGD